MVIKIDNFLTFFNLLNELISLTYLIGFKKVVDFYNQPFMILFYYVIQTHKNRTYYLDCGLEDLGKLNYVLSLLKFEKF